MSLVETEWRHGAVWLWLNRPERHNALVPPLTGALRSALAELAEQEPAALVLSGRGHSFSTGGDIAGFLEHAGSRQALRDYSEGLVGDLHDAILELLAFPAPVLAAVNGAVTGGSAGLLFAADMVAMSDRAFLQPYYCEVGFAPDGGWTALLPDRVGPSKALEIQYRNARIGAAEALALGLASSVCPRSELATQIDAWVDDLGKGFARTHRVTRQGVWDERRREEVRRRLDLERARFLELVERPETLDGMKRFTRQRA
ncbi:enoyl-CoA hydratase/isomerase family protein [Roseibium salinum]|uniref:Enoyl-CoA hydratase/isomerase family protein n=1 Tax=Roseibium salinum TaxID=1604349 RepID=A0ABT3R8Q6_9HYPH|nr:enoyl-CoA hydratase/isomerase family protein [Roseibium sp. DSM 29163]MCX2725494.1 enoyl-CoA hydratase/isomerase family protein [Roseibium sp. DSM 29163]